MIIKLKLSNFSSLMGTIYPKMHLLVVLNVGLINSQFGSQLHDKNGMLFSSANTKNVNTSVTVEDRG